MDENIFSSPVAILFTAVFSSFPFSYPVSTWLLHSNPNIVEENAAPGNTSAALRSMSSPHRLTNVRTWRRSNFPNANPQVAPEEHVHQRARLVRHLYAKRFPDHSVPRRSVFLIQHLLYRLGRRLWEIISCKSQIYVRQRDYSYPVAPICI